MMNLKARSRSWYEAVSSSYWFVPTVMAVLAVFLSIATVWLDQRVPPDWLGNRLWRYAGSADGARTLLGTIANSMIGVAGVVFSITIVALTLATAQFGPRLLRNFMRDKGNQLTLGTFLAAFVYCLLILRTVHSGGEDRDLFVPELSIFLAVLMAVAGLAVLIFFIHHAAESIQAPNVIASVAHDLHRAIERLYPEPSDEDGTRAADQEREGALPVPGDFGRNSVAVRAGRGGYVQRVEADELLREAVEGDLLLRIERRPGEYVQGDDAVVRAWPAARVDGDRVRRIAQTFTVSAQRSMTQDAGFAMEQLVEVACRAISPGINDPFTAMQCLDRIGEGLSLLCGRTIPSPHHRDDDGELRVIGRQADVEGFMDLAFDQIRRYAERAPDVMVHMLVVMERIGPHVRRDADRRLLEAHAERVYRQALETCTTDHDRREVERRFGAFTEALRAGAELH